VTILVAKEETEIMEPALFRFLFNEDLSKWLSIMHYVPKKMTTVRYYLLKKGEDPIISG
jgi:hypothetical protein